MRFVSSVLYLLVAFGVATYACGQQCQDDGLLVVGGAVGAMRLHSMPVRPTVHPSKLDTSELFQAEFGAENSTEYASTKHGQFRYKNEKSKFEAYAQAVRRKYGNGPEVEVMLESQRRSHMTAVKDHNSGYNASRKIKANVAERISDAYFCKGGYTKIDCSVGSHGIDGVYVKDGGRSIIITDAKSDTATLSQTTDGYYQLSPEWCLKKIDEKIAQLSSVQPPTEETRKAIKILKTIRRYLVAHAANVKIRVVHVDVCVNEAGHSCIRFQTYDVIFESGSKNKPTLKPSGDGEIIDMQKPDSLLTPRQRRLKELYFEKFLEELDALVAKGGGNGKMSYESNRKFVESLRKAYAEGKITTVDELIDFILKYVNDPAEAQKIVESAGSAVSQNAKKSAVLKQMAIEGGVSALLMGGLSILGDWYANGEIDSDSLGRAITRSGEMGGVVVGLRLLELAAERFDRVRELNNMRTDHRPKLPADMSRSKGPRFDGKSPSGRIGRQRVKTAKPRGKTPSRKMKFRGLPTKALGVLYVAMDVKYQTDLNHMHKRGYVSGREYRTKTTLNTIGIVGVFGAPIGGLLGAGIGFLCGGPPGAAAGAKIGWGIGSTTGGAMVVGSAGGNIFADSYFTRENRRLANLCAELRAKADSLEKERIWKRKLEFLASEAAKLRTAAAEILAR